MREWTLTRHIEIIWTWVQCWRISCCPWWARAEGHWLQLQYKSGGGRLSQWWHIDFACYWHYWNRYISVVVAVFDLQWCLCAQIFKWGDCKMIEPAGTGSPVLPVTVWLLWHSVWLFVSGRALFCWPVPAPQSAPLLTSHSWELVRKRLQIIIPGNI